MKSHYSKIIAFMCTRPAIRRASLIVGMEFSIESCVQGHHFSKEFCTSKVGEELVREEGDPKDVYVVALKTNAKKTVQIKCSNDLSSFQLYFIINFVLTEPKLTCGSVKFSACMISHFVMNIIMAKTGSTAKVKSAT